MEVNDKSLPYSHYNTLLEYIILILYKWNDFILAIGQM